MTYDGAPHPLRTRLLAAAVVLVAALALVDSYPWSGPVLLTLSSTHGVHAADLPVVALAAAAVGLLARSSRAAVRPAPVLG